jgi:L-asparaginase II
VDECGTTDNPANPALLAEVWRGPMIESRHRGHLVAVTGDGRVVAALGQGALMSYFRSSAKPFQAIPLVVSGAADRFGFNEQELALACASHNGEPLHTGTVAGMLRKIGLDAGALKCGAHEPFNVDVARALRASGRQPNALHNNCSGKHAGFLAQALHLEAPVATYEEVANPVQQSVLETVARFAGVPPSSIVLAVDGCGAPVFGLALEKMALMYARLVAPPPDFDEPTRAACQRIAAAMMNYPEVIGGRAERLDTKIMQAAPGRIVSKIGAEGVYTAGVLPCAAWPQGLGLAAKIEDGEDRRARPVVVLEALRQLGALTDAELRPLTPYAHLAIRNHRGDLVGEVRPAFTIPR